MPMECDSSMRTTEELGGQDHIRRAMEAEQAQKDLQEDNAIEAEALAATKSESLHELQIRQSRLKESMGKQQRDIDGVSDDMLEDCKTLLRLFGLPFLVSPMEA